MSLHLSIKFPENLVSAELVEKKNIPCLCKVGKAFEIEFMDPLPEATGEVHGWDRELLGERSMPGVGGMYTHYRFGMVTLEQADAGTYRIVDLAMFDTSFGWCPIIVNGEYGPPGMFYDDPEDDDIGR